MLPRLFLVRQVHGFVKVGNVKVPVHQAKNLELVPIGFSSRITPPAIVQHIKWLLQKDLLKQDVFFIGPPGALRARVVLMYLELSNREFEYLSISRDTTEADIKQRREIRGGNAFYSDLCAVSAALNGRVLVIDGVEKAERNVLPILNNLLENREMQLEDGRFLMAASRYDKLLEKYSQEELKKMKLERVSEDFHVIALGLPVPAFKGHSLDPPLRSRFQSRQISELPFSSMSSLCEFLAPNVGMDRLNTLLALAYGINSQKAENSAITLPLVPIDNLLKAVQVWNLNTSYSAEHIFSLCYPSDAILKKDTQLPIFEDFLQRFTISREPKKVEAKVEKIAQDAIENHLAHVDITFDKNTCTAKVPFGGHISKTQRHSYIPTVMHEKLLSDLMLTHANADFCLLGERGSGKTTIIEEFAQRLGYNTETIVLYQDMNSRELVQQRRMLENGDTIWEDSQLVRAAKRGDLCILDGVERIHWSALEILAPLIHFRYLQLPDGTRLIGSVNFDLLMNKTGQAEEELNKKGVYKISDRFRLVALGDASGEESKGSTWLNEQVGSLFLFHSLKTMSISEKHEIIEKVVPHSNPETSLKLLKLVDLLHASSDAGIRGIALSLSFRRLLYILKRHSLNSSEGIYCAVQRAAMSRFLPPVTKVAFEKALSDVGIVPDEKSDEAIDHKWKESLAGVHKTAIHETMVPEILFYDNEQHLRIMNDMARDFELGSHLLLIGNQGVGKNKVTDRFLQLINRPRKYIQLHRDTTVQSLTVQTTVVDGILKHEDSPLVQAVKNGYVLVIDEADKAPLHVVAILKSLLDSGVLYLSDGRRIQPDGFPPFENDKHIRVHKDFRIIMLANRPGFPFLGNNLFGLLGDLFSVHIVGNPSRDEEMAMLQQYGPDVPIDKLKQLVAAFDELREMADNSLLSYPYSTRELVNIVKHLQLFPDDSLVFAIRNVFDFDAYSSKDVLESIYEVFQKHGIPLGIDRPHEKIYLSKRFSIDPPKSIGEWGIQDNVKPDLVEYTKFPIHPEKADSFMRRMFSLDMHHMRSTGFSEQEYLWQLPINDVNICSDCIQLNQDGRICVASVNPVGLYVIEDPRSSKVMEIELYDWFPPCRGDFRPRIKLSKWTENSLLVHEEMTNTLLIIDLENLNILKVGTEPSKPTIMSSVINKITQPKVELNERHWRLISGDVPILFQKGSNLIKLLRPETTNIVQLNLPETYKLKNIIVVNADSMLLEDFENGYRLLTIESDGRMLLRPIETNGVPGNIEAGGKVLDSKGQVSSNLFTSEPFLALKSSGFPETWAKTEVLAWGRDKPNRFVENKRPYYASEQQFKFTHPQKEWCIFPNGLVVRALSNWAAPEKALPKEMSVGMVGGFLEVLDTNSNSLQYVPVPVSKYQSYHYSWVSSISKAPFVLANAGEKSLLTCDSSGAIRKWEIDEASIAESLTQWTRMFGMSDTNERIEFERSESEVDLSKLDEPKLGKFDPSNIPHVGGNTWMGGTGGYNTAGLGGVGGPFRVDAGHDVHQIPDSAKEQVPEHILKKAREIAKSEYQKRLKEIEMSEHDADAYGTLHKKVERQTTMLKNIIDSLEAKEKERQWAKHQTSGDLDDGKLIEGMTGEKTIYRRRMDLPPEAGSQQKNPKRIRLVFDVSGSMYRFNGYDKRLQRSLETALLVMEALEGKEEKIKYDIVGHSGDGPEIPFVVANCSPKNEKERLNVLRKMLAHTQFCASGDYTLEALEMATAKLAKETDVDERFVVVLSDANLDRYGIQPKHLVKYLQSDESVDSFIVFIGSLGQQAAKLQKALPAGKAYVATDTAQLPQIMQSIFSSTLIK